MKKYILILVLILVSSCDFMANTHKSLLFENDKPTHVLTELLNFLQIKHDGTKIGIVKATQQPQPEGLMRAAGKERWEIENWPIENQKKLQSYLDNLGMRAALVPQKKQYEYAVILGATLPAMRARVAYLKKLWLEQGIRFNQLVFLTGQRPAAPNETKENVLDADNGQLSFKTDWQLKEMPTNETEFARLIMEQSALPKEWQEITTTFVDTPPTVKKDGTTIRPTTPDTIKFWLDSYKPKPGSIIAISGQPHAHYQDATLRTYMPSEFQVETVGSAQSDQTTDAVVLDALARWIYQEAQ